MNPWRAVQERLYQEWRTGWDQTTPFCFANDPALDPPDGYWARFTVKSGISQQGSMGPPGVRRFDRSGRIFIQLYGPPGKGVGSLSDLAGQGQAIFEGKHFAPGDIRFNEVDIGDEGLVDKDRWWGCLVEGRFDWEEIK